MITQMKLNMLVLKTLILFFISTIAMSAQSSIVTPLTDFIETYGKKHLAVSTEIENKTDITFAQKLAIHNTKLSKLKEEFKTNRKSEYLLKTVKRAKRHSCTGDRSRGVTDCGYAYVKAPNKNMYTTEEWIKTEGINEGIIIEDNNSSVGMKMTVTGKKTIKGALYVIFKYKPGLIDAIVEKETTDLFKEILTKEKNVNSIN